MAFHQGSRPQNGTARLPRCTSVPCSWLAPCHLNSTFWTWPGSVKEVSANERFGNCPTLIHHLMGLRHWKSRPIRKASLDVFFIGFERRPSSRHSLLKHTPKTVPSFLSPFVALQHRKSQIASPHTSNFKTLKGPKPPTWYDHSIFEVPFSFHSHFPRQPWPLRTLEDQTMLTEVSRNTASERIYRYSSHQTRLRSQSSLHSP